MTKRESWIPPVLTMCTCGIYLFYWQYVTTKELGEATGRADLNPLTDLIVSLLCCGFWSIYVQYRNAQVVHETFTSRGQQHDEKSTLILICHVASFFNGLTGLFALMVLQDEYNRCADLLASAPPPSAF